MRLYISSGSPFVRKARIVLREKGLKDRVEEIIADPYSNDPPLVAANPIVQVPALVAEDGLPMTDSTVIAAYFDEIGSGPKLLPASGPELWRVKRAETRATGALELSVKLVLEGRRPEDERSPKWIARWMDGMLRAMDAMEADLPKADPLDMGVINTVVAATYIGFRNPDLDWKSSRPGLAALVAELEQRPSFVETFPY